MTAATPPRAAGLVLHFWIPGPPPATPNLHRALNLRARMRLIAVERDKAWAVVRSTALHIKPIREACAIRFEVRRRYLLDPLANLPASLKQYQDGLCKALLPLGDGPNTPYTWLPPTQVKVKTKAEEGVHITVEPLA